MGWQLILLSLNIFVFLLILTILLLYEKRILFLIDGFSIDLREFINRNDSFFSVLFLCLFFAEQLLLIFLVFFYKNSQDILQIIIGIFALIVVTTASLEKIILELKLKYSREEMSVLKGMGELAPVLLERLIQKMKRKQ